MKNFVSVPILMIFSVTLMISSVYAVPEMINYQGQVQVNGEPFTGTGYFRFAIIDSQETLIWSNDGNMPPETDIPVSVTDSLYHITLGNGMEAIPATVFNTMEPLFLRIWFSDGTLPIEQLTPDQRLSSVGFSMTSDSSRDSDTVDGFHATDFMPAETDLWVNISGDTMIGPLTLPEDGLRIGTDQLVTLNGKIGIGTSNPTSMLHVNGLPEFPSNAAALTGGMTYGAFYRTGDLVKVVHEEIPTPTPTETPIPTSTPTNTPVPTSTPTNTPIPTSTPTNTPVPTSTPTPTPTNTQAPTSTPPIQPQVFNYTGNVQTFTIPDGVTAINVDAYGAQGGDGWNVDGGGSVKGLGGLGGLVHATLTVTPGELLYIYIGGTGQDATTTPGMGGWNGGGNGGGSTSGYSGGGGGGATDIRRGGTELTNRILVAGGGGSGSGWCTAGTGNGGVGGGLTGGSGQMCSSYPVGTGGTQSAGGTTGGALGIGGTWTNSTWAASAGGGGYYGGGASHGSGGGGGSSYVTPTGSSNVSHSQGVRNGHGQISITW